MRTNFREGSQPTPESVEILRLLRADLPLTQRQRIQELRQFGSAQAVLDLHSPSLFSVAGTEEADLVAWAAQGFHQVSILDDQYPHFLRSVDVAPGLLYWQGALQPDERGICIVGSRNANDVQKQVAFDLSYQLAAKGVPIISGLAAGIDAAAHEGALAAGGRTIAVMGTGLDRTYPPHHGDLRTRILTAGGLVLSPFEPYSPVRKFNFPHRNAVMSGYSAGTIVIAAAEKSGTRHHVLAAVKQQRPVLLAQEVVNAATWARDLITAGHADTFSTLEEAASWAHELCSHQVPCPNSRASVEDTVIACKNLVDKRRNDASPPTRATTPHK